MNKTMLKPTVKSKEKSELAPTNENLLLFMKSVENIVTSAVTNDEGSTLAVALNNMMMQANNQSR